MLNPLTFVFKVRSIIPENFKSLSLVVFEKNAGHEKPEIGRISPPEVNFTKLFHVTLDLISVYNIYKFHVNHLKNKGDLGH